MFELSADVYDLIYSFKDYGAESQWVRDTIRAACPKARTLLDVACGTGSHLEHLRHDFACQGLDNNARFVAIAGERAGVPVHLGDMDDFDLGEAARFDAVICMFSAIGYSQDLDGALRSMARHLGDGGVVIIEPWFTPDQWTPGHIQVIDEAADGLHVVRMGHSGRDGDTAVLTMHHLVGTPVTIDHFVETHRLRLYTLDEYEAAFRAAGLTFAVDQPGPAGRGALIGRRS